MVSAQHDGQTLLLQLIPDGIVHDSAPGNHLGQMAVAIHNRQPRVGRSGQVTAIFHIDTTTGKGLGNAGYTQGLWSHARSARARTYIVWRANQTDGRNGRGRYGHRLL